MTTQTESLVESRCCSCGILFAMPEPLQKIRVQDGAVFYCPNGHAQGYTNTPAHHLAEMTKERDMWKAEAERLLEECDKLHSQSPVRAVWFDRWKRGGK